MGKIKLNEKELNRRIRIAINEMSNKFICYHGSNDDFNSFDLSYVGESNGNIYGYGIYLTTNKETASRYGKNLYTVTIPNDIRKYLNTEKYQDVKTVLNIKNKLFKLLTSEDGDYFGAEKDLKRDFDRTSNKMTGTEIYTFILYYLGEGDYGVAEFLYNLGYIGMVYPNDDVFIMFNPKDINIVKKDISTY